MMFKSLNGLAPVNLQDLFSERHTDYDLRDSFCKLNLPKPRTDYLKPGRRKEWAPFFSAPCCVALAIAVPYYGILSLKILGRLDQLGSLRKKSTAHL